jgi:glycerophosphoryl diester phosphodiesterase
MIFDSKPSIVGHRGFGAGNRGGYRENTVPSFLAAVA